MAEQLSAFGGNIAYLDAVALVGYLDADSRFHPACRAFIDRSVEPGRIVRLVTAALTIDEVAFTLLQELVARPPYEISRNRSPYLARQPGAVKALSASIERPLRALMDIMEIEAVLAEDVSQMIHLMANHGLLPRDAIHVAVARRLGITAIVSDDDVFDQIPGIRLYKP